MEYDWIGFSHRLGFSWHRESYKNFDGEVFISDYRNSPMKSFHRDIYWDDKIEERMRVFEL